MLVSVLAIQLANPQAGDSAHSLKQEQSRISGRETSIVLTHAPISDTTLETLLLGRYTSEDIVAAIDSLLMQHPELRPLLLREILMPGTDEAYLQPLSAREVFSKQVVRMSSLSHFEQMSLEAKRYRELYQFSAENRMLVPQVDLLGTIPWIFLELARVLK